MNEKKVFKQNTKSHQSFFSYESLTSSEDNFAGSFSYMPQAVDLSVLLKTVINNELTDAEKAVIHKRCYEGKSVTVTAKELHLNPSTVSRTANRAMRKIRKNLKYALFVLNGRFPTEDMTETLREEKQI